MKKDILNKFSRKFNKFGLVCKKHSPEAFVVAGVAGMVVSTIMACKATTKLNDILEGTKHDIELIKDAAEHPETLPEPYSQEDAQKDIALTYVQTGVKLVKLYGPAIVVGTLSMTSILMSHRILSKRNVALSSAFMALNTQFKDYRNNVISRFGEKIDKELRYGIKTKEVETVMIDENGNEVIEKQMVDEIDKKPYEYSDYARFFDVGNPYWEKDPEYNLMFLKQRQQWANEKLQAQGYLFLNDVYEALGLEKTKAGHVVGWIYDEKHPIGDNYVDFGIYDIASKPARDFVNGRERTILLDFNVDGNIYDMM